ncbi:MAG TPA: aminotransferase class III-fold pyridoxal phosphate-dependent enzyme, partial [Chitinispirillaceae bacterium]|nr:aminotransferase class III-fold pyridoxal phosphate-dependent enzyme [Chitinispirillaceae bacterium]
VVCSEKFASAISPGDHGTTFGGNPVACALGCELLKIISSKPFLKGVKQKGSYLKKKLSALKKVFKDIEDIRGTGLLLGVQLKDDPTAVVAECKNKGLLVVKAGKNTIRFMPPLTVSESEIDKAVAVFSEVLSRK